MSQHHSAESSSSLNKPFYLTIQPALLSILKEKERPESNELKEQDINSENELNRANMYKDKIGLTMLLMKDKIGITMLLMNANSQTVKLQENKCQTSPTINQTCIVNLP